YQQELELLKTVRNQIQAELDSQQQTLSQLSVETQQQFRDIHKLIHWLEMLNHDLTAVFNSQTWRSGDLITRIVLKLMLRAPGLTARDHIKKIMDEFFYWRIHNRATPQHSEPKQDYLPAVIEAKKKIRIAALVALHHGEPSASASIRLILPLQHPSIQQQVHLEVYTAFDYLFYVAADIIVIQRHMVADAAAAQRLIDHCQQQHIKLVYETDDDLYNIFKKRDIYGSYPKNMLDGLNLITQHADSVITSSEPLRAQISQLNPQVVCVPNALDEQLWLEQRQGQFIQPQPQTFDNKIRILYMGTKTHSADLQLIKPAYQKIQKTYGDQVVLEIIGGFSDDNAVFAEVIQPEYLTAAETPDEYTRFVHWFRQHNRWQIGIIPLKDNAFNQKKTYIKFLDYSALGLASICSDVAPYRDIVRHEDNGLLVKNETEAWYHALKRLIEDAELRQQLAQQAFSDLTQHYILQHTAARFLQAYRHVLAQPQVTESAALELSAIEASHRDYARWISAYDTLDKKTRQQMVQRIQSWSQPPLISILMPTYNIAEPWLRAALDSVRQQIYPHWQLCIVDDASTEAHVRPLLERYAQQEPRIKLHFRQQNGHISAASNDALKLAEGQYIALLDHDDLLAPQALYWVAEEILAHPEVKLIYSDEDKIDAQGRRSGAYFKSDWNPDLFLSHNLITHLAVYHTDLLKTIDGFREGYEGAQDYDLALRAIEQIDAQQIRHIPRVLYHWRTIETSMAGNPLAKPYAIQAAQQAIQEHFRRQSISAQVAESANMSGMLRVRYPLPAAPPQVTLIIPTYNQVNLLKRCVDSLLKKTDYPHFDIVIVDNRSDEPATLAYLQQLATHAPIQILPYPHPFNFAALNNEAVKHARGEIIGFLNNDLEVINADWLSEMVSHALRPEIGVVGARLWYPHQRLQHGGIVLGIGGVAEHAHKNLLWGQSGYFGRAQVIQNFSAVTAACMLMRKQVFQAVGGFDSEHLSIAFNDVDLCLKCIQQGLRVLWTPYAD
ncbi:MAG: glycosyltransferase, partial [Pseudomonadota bacterium]|nr:glycosyltransferase [Pseudomonadota bacterium]